MSLDLSAMTLADAEALAARLETAARTIRDALAMMGTPHATVSVPFVQQAGPFPDAVLTVTPPPPPGVRFLPDLHAPIVTNKGPVRLTDAEQAQRDALRREREAEEFAADQKKLAGA